jgi:hypothetical protein
MADEWPKLYHPARYVETDYVVDTTTTSEGYQLRPDTWRDLARWCGGDTFIDQNGNQAVQVTDHDSAHLGDFVMNSGGVFHVEPADGHYQRWSPV